jgi:hypothetical protein
MPATNGADFLSLRGCPLDNPHYFLFGSGIADFGGLPLLLAGPVLHDGWAVFNNRSFNSAI